MADVALRVARSDAQTFRDEREWDVWCAFANADLRARNHIGPIYAAPPTLAIVVQGIASAEAFGTALLTLDIAATGIASAEAFGTAALGLDIAVTGIATAEAFGTALVSLGIVVQGIASAEAFGTCMVNALGVEVAPEVGSSWKRIRRNRKW